MPIRFVPLPIDWHPADVHAALKKSGHSLRSLSIAHGYHPTAAGKALRSSWPAMEQIIADVLHQTPQAIWPSRYDPSGTPFSRRRGKGRVSE